MRTPLRHLLASGAIALVLAIGFGSTGHAVSSVVDVPPPMVSDYWVSVSRQPGGVLVFDGYAPDASTRDALGEVDGADINWLKLGSGAPANYDAAVEFGLGVMNRMSEGRFALRGSVISFSGVAASQADFLAFHQNLEANMPAGLILAMAQVQAPLVDNYAFSARRQANGNLILSGFVPNPEIEQRLLAATGPRSSSTLRFGSGEPLNFEAMLAAAMPLLSLLSEGEVKLDGGAWLLSGTPKSDADAASINAAFASNRLAEAGWSLALSEAIPAAPDTPYTWSAEKSAAGAVVMTGSVPTEALQRILALRVGSGLMDNTDVLADAPEGFITHALSAIDALASLKEGKVGFDGAKWFIEGQGETTGAAEVLAQNVVAPADDWQIAVSDPSTTPAEVQSVTAAAAEAPVEEQPVPEATPPAVEAPIPAASMPENIDKCRTVLADLSATNGILFRSGAAILAEGVGPALQAIASAVGECPSIAIDVAGHTDADGEAAANLALSVARAETVVSALVALGVAPERLYAIGFGESQPIADNDTAAGKAQNRRIVVSVHDGD